ncbi:MAG: right-handed parallel beta-helix repeat-containing protein, partial [Pirellula sp.]
PSSIDSTFNLTSAINTLNSQGAQGQAIASATNAFVQQSSQVPSGFSFSLPLLKKPSSSLGLLLGKDVDLFKVDLPAINLHFSIEESFPIFPPINGVFAGSMDLHVDLAFGYDTAGIREFRATGYDLNQKSKLANGFFIYDRVDGQRNPTDQGTPQDDKPELSLTGVITVGAGVGGFGLNASVNGDVTAEVTLDLPDGDQSTLADGRSRFHELAACGINVEGTLSAGLGAQVVLEIPFAPDITLFKKSIARATLLDFTSGCVVPTPLATLSNGILTLNVGTSQDEKVAITPAKDKNGVDVVRVQMFGVAQDFPRAQVQQIVANFGGGNDLLYIDPQLTIPLVIDGGIGNDSLAGGAGNDTIRGGDGDDQITGGPGNDMLFGQANNDQLDGDEGNDELYGGLGDDVISGGAGDDYVQGNVGNDMLIGGDGNDSMFGDHEVDGIERGDDALDGGSGDDTLVGGPGNDIIQGADGNDIIRGDTVSGIVPSPIGFNNDSLFGDAGNDTIEGGVGNDAIMSGTGNDLLYGHSITGVGDDNSADQLYGDADDDQLFGQGGEDLLEGSDGNDQLFGGNDNDTLRGQNGVDRLHGGAGNDQLFGGEDDDVLEGDAGADTLHGDQREDRLFGHSESGIGDDATADTLFGDQGEDELHGNAGVDALYGGANDDMLFGDAGNDTLEGGAGVDELHGGANDDLLFGHSASGLTDDSKADELFGDDGNDTLHGNAGNDILHGDVGADVLYGNSGEDFLEGNSGVDTLFGGEDTDLLFGHSATGIGDDNSSDTLFGDFGIGHVLGSAGNVLLAGRDELFGQGGNDDLYGEEFGDEIYGGIGNDTVRGGAGEDYIDGDAGNDQLFGGANADRIFGREGDDTIHGDEGDDQLYGGNGVDTIHGDTDDDQLFGEGSEDLLHGGLGNDLLVAGAGIVNQLFGDEGDDRLIGSDEGTDDANLLDATYFGDILSGGDGDDEIRGLGGADDINGDAGDDWIDGGVRSDRIRGGAGRDTLYGAHGRDRIEGGNENDRIYGEEGTDLLHGDDGNDYVDGGMDADMLFGGEDQDELIGGGGVGDQLFGEAGADVLQGSDDGADIMQGGPGSDRLLGQGGNDTLRGGDDDDVLLGGAGDDVLEGETGRDVLAGEADHDTLYGHNQSASGDDNAVDHLYGDFATNDDEAGSGQDRLFGGGGNDLLYGEAGDDFIDAGGGLDNTVDFGTGDGVVPNNFVPPSPTAPPLVLASVPHVRTDSSLPAGITDRGRWQQLAGSAVGLGLGGNTAGAIDPAIAISPAGQVFTAWSDARNGNYEIYVAKWNGNAWQGLAGSDQHGGVSNSVGTSQHPSLTTNAAGQPLISWMEAGDIYVAQFDPAANSGQGAWVALADSLGSGGISGTGTTDHPVVVNTATGPAVAWLNHTGSTTEIRVKQFNGTTWNAVGTSAVVSAVDLSQLFFATNGVKLAVAWSQTVAGIARVFALEFAGSTWQGVAGSNSGNGISTSNLAADQPSIAYYDGTIHVAWRQYVRLGTSETEIYSARPVAGVWEQVNVSATGGTASQPRLAVGGNQLHLAWAEELVASGIGTGTTVYATRWNGTEFIEKFAQSGDINGGITGTGDGLQALALAVNPTGAPFVAWSNSSANSTQVHVRGDTLVVNRLMYTSEGIPLATLLELNTMQPGDIVVVHEGVQTAPVTLTAAHSGVFILGEGAGLSQLGGKVTLTGANNVTFSRVDLSGGLDAKLTSGLEIVASRIEGSGLLLDGTTNTRLIGNLIDGEAVGVELQFNTNALVEYNAIFGSTTGVLIKSTETGSQIVNNSVRSNDTGLQLMASVMGGMIRDNDIQATTLGVDYASSSVLLGNTIHGAVTGVKVAAGQVLQSDPTDLYDRFLWSDTNQISNNQIGVQLFGTILGQVIRDNTTGVTGTGTLGPAPLGPAPMSDANLIYRNATGADFSGAIQFNWIDSNGIGIKAKGDSQIAHNQFADNVTAGILVNNVTDVQISNNTLYSSTGDNIRIENLAKEVEVRGNSLWVDQGFDIFVADNARSGFFSDYNQLHATGTGKLVHWMRDFADILDWQVDVNVHDLHSIGSTVVNSDGAAPMFVSMPRGDYRQASMVGGLGSTSPGVDGADPRNDVVVPATYVNLLTNPSFESGISGWTINVQGTAGAPNSTPFHGAAYFVPGTVATGVAEQTINLLAAGLSSVQLDSQNLNAVFGGRVRSKNESSIDTASITLAFRDGSGVILSQQTRAAANVGDRWDLVGDRLALPVGTRQITYRFESIRATGTTNDAHLDNAFVYIVSESMAPDFGAYGNTIAEPIVPAAHLTLTYPDLYIDWQRDVAKTVRWQSLNNSTNSPVRIDLMQDGVHGPQLVTTIATSTQDDGEFIVIPANLGVNFDTTGLRIQISLANDPITMDRAQESFTVPDNSNTYFADDASNTNDEYTLGAIGSNRNTGKTASAPKPHPVNLLRAYDLPAGSIVSIDTGTYPMFDAIRLSGTFDLGLGLDEGFTLRGPTNTAKHVSISWIYPDNHPQALVELNDADFMTLINLDVTGSQRGLWVTGGSDNFTASFITARNQSLDAIDITPINPAANFVGLVAENAGRNGIVINGTFASLSDGRAANAVDRGILLTNPGNARVEAMEVFGNRIAIDVNNNNAGTQTVIGNADLSLGRGNMVRDNTQIGIFAGSRTLVAGNTVHGHRLSGFTIGIQASGSGSEVVRNVVFDNQTGIFVQAAVPVRENRVYGNLNTGITASGGSQVVSNVVYDNPIGIAATASTALIANNLIYDNATVGLKLSQGNSPDVINNTIYATTGMGIRAEANVQNLELRNNVVWATGGIGVSIANDSQTGLLSDFNLLFASGTGLVGNWVGANQTTLQAWQIATGKDANSLTNNPLFVDLDGADNVLGFVLGGVDGSDDDFHLQSPFGSLHGGSQAPVRSSVTGLPVFATGMLTN